ncbi:hypothetical protein KR093_001358 [Drosophila rubida]|uniref:RNA-binding protein 5-A n=1 Tax=Drosophila rubida TaxID=30044 RepID=A0AAD4PMT8_9MUSC|nr:hypothetical protein KR093_001358 [Drosophila rubida]
MDSHSRYGRSFSGGGAGGGNGGGGGNQYRRQYSRSRSRSRERSREQAGYRRRNSRSRSRERSTTHHYRNAGSADKDLYRDLINDDYNDERGGGSSYNSNYNSSRGNNNYHHRRDDSSDRDRDRDRDRERDRDRDRERDRERERDRDQRWKHYDREPRERNSDFDRGNERRYQIVNYSREYRSHNNNGNGNNAVVSTNRDRDRRYSSDEESYDSDESDDSQYRRNNVRTSNEALNQIIIFGLKKHITEADIMGALIQVNMEPSSIRLIRKRPTGASRGFAFVEFNTVEEATRWMELTQGNLKLGDQRVFLQYSHKRITDWHCIKCGVYNFKRRFSCFMCMASRAESESIYTGGGEGIDEVSPILTKKIMLRNLDALTTEESVLTALQKVLPKQAKTITKVLISRDALTQTSRGFCYLEFETLVDSMDVHNALTALETPLRIDERDVCISYCNDVDSNQVASKDALDATGSSSHSLGALAAVPPSDAGGEYTLADVPRLAEYSASLYASTPAEHAHYVQYYTDYYVAEIKKGGQLGGGGSGEAQVTEANSGAAVALSAIQRKQKKMNSIETTATAAATAAAQAAAAVKASFAAQTVVAPRGNDGKTYPTPDVTRYQYDETSGYYYDPSTGLYYDAHSQYYYNNETGAYLYWDQRRSTYILATPASTQAALQETLAQESSAAAADQKEEEKKEKGKDSSNKHDKVKVAKKIVKDMEKWAKQLNQKKDYTVVATPQPILPGRGDLGSEAPSSSRAAAGGAYADVGFSILEKKERGKLNDYVPTPAPMNKLVNAYGGGSDSEEDSSGIAAGGAPAAAGGGGGGGGGAVDEMDYVDFQKLTCLLCKRAFQSHDILQKHLKMSNLHKENLAKLNNQCITYASPDHDSNHCSYRDRAKERRLKYGEGDPPPPNRSRERFEHEIKNLQTRQKDGGSAAPAMPISSNNVGNRLLQKMGWSEGQGLGRKNQGRTQIIEAEARSNNIGLGNKGGTLAPGDDYKTYIKKMMKSRYENA